MKKLIVGLCLSASLFAQMSSAQTPTETLRKTVDQLIKVVSNKTKDTAVMRAEVSTIIHANVDFEVVSQRVISRPWRDANDKQKSLFTKQFADIVVDTYFSLLQNYSGEKVNYGQEQIKKDKYAIVDTEVISEGKKIPVRYRLINNGERWKIYDFIVEGSSLVSSYKNSYKIILNKEGMDGLLEEMMKNKEKPPSVAEEQD